MFEIFYYKFMVVIFIPLPKCLKLWNYGHGPHNKYTGCMKLTIQPKFMFACVMQILSLSIRFLNSSKIQPLSCPCNDTFLYHYKGKYSIRIWSFSFSNDLYHQSSYMNLEENDQIHSLSRYMMVWEPGKLQSNKIEDLCLMLKCTSPSTNPLSQLHEILFIVVARSISAIPNGGLFHYTKIQ